MYNLPVFESDFLSELTRSFSKVRKSVKYDAANLSFNKVIDNSGAKQLEKIELSIRSSLSRNGISIRF